MYQTYDGAGQLVGQYWYGGTAGYSESYTYDPTSGALSSIWAMPMGDNLICSTAGALQIIDIQTGDEKTLPWRDDASANDRIVFICDDAHLYVSYQATQTDGSVVKDIEDPSNGVWSVDPETLEYEQLCEATFEELYLFDGDLLYGVRDDTLFLIDTGAGTLLEVA